MFTVNDVKHYVYCPVIIYITHVLGINETETQYMALGKEIETKKAVASAIKLVNAIEVRRNIPVRSTRLGLSGIIDYVLITKNQELVPLDIKWSEAAGSPRTDHVVQLTAYAVMLEETFNTWVKLGLLYYVTRDEGRIYKVYITSELRRRLENVVAGMKNVVRNGITNVKIDRKKCEGCNYRMHCPIR